MCITCDILTCGICQLTIHKNHVFYTLEDGGSKIRLELQRLKKDIE